ncbi:hypothetical protein CDL60_25000 [Roseateles noduli]|nr:hypothetical protein CDL60_25000 [Roseateles noduli]
MPSARFLGNFSNVVVSSESGDCDGASAQVWARPVLKNGRVQPVWQPYGFWYDAGGTCPGIEFRIIGGEFRPATGELHLAAAIGLGHDKTNRIDFKGIWRADRLAGKRVYGDPDSGVLLEEGAAIVLEAAGNRRWNEIGPSIGLTIEAAGNTTEGAPRAADETVLRVKEIRYEFKVETPNESWAPEGQPLPPVTYRELDIVWAYPVFLDGDPEQTGRLNAWLRRWWLEGIGVCGAELPVDRLASMRDEEMVAHVKATAKSDGCGETQSVVEALGGLGPYLSFVRHSATAGFRPGNAREDKLIRRDSIAAVAASELFDADGVSRLTEAFQASVAREHPDCRDLPTAETSLLQLPDLLIYERPFHAKTWNDCGDINTFQGIQVRRALTPEVRAMKRVRIDYVN